MSMRFLSDKEISEASREQLEAYQGRLHEEAAASAERFARENNAQVDSYTLKNIFRGAQEKTRQGLYAAATFSAFNSKEARDFRYNSLALSHGWASYLHGFFGGHEMVDLTTPAGLAAASASGLRFAALEADKGFPWAKANPEKVEDYVLSTIDPLMFDLGGPLKAMRAMPEIDQLAHVVPDILEAKDHAEAIAATRGLWGQDMALKSNYDAIKQLDVAGHAPSEIAEWMYHQGYRSAEWALRNPMPLSDWFKRGGNLASPRLMSIVNTIFDKSASAGEKVEQLLSGTKAHEILDQWRGLVASMDREFRAAKAALPELSKDELKAVQELTHAVPRDPWDPVGSFRLNYNEMRAAGKVPEFPEAVLDAADKYVAHLSAGWREGTAYRSAYGVGAAEAQRINLGINDARLSLQQLSEKLWRQPQRMKGMIEGAENYQTWAANVFTREKFSESLVDFFKMLKDRAETLDAAADKASGAAAESLRAEAEITRQAAAAVDNFYSSPDFVKYAGGKGEAAARVALDLYDKGLNLMKAALLRYNPAFWAHRLGDMGIVRPLIETGRPALGDALRALWNGHTPAAFAFDGRYLSAEEREAEALGQISAGQSPLDSSYGAEMGQRTWTQRLNHFIDRRIEAVDRAGTDFIARHHYAKAAREGLRMGLEGDALHTVAERAAKNAVDLVSGFYHKSSPFQQVARRVFLFSDHYLGTMTHMLTRASESPAEAYALLRLRQAQQDISTDRHGAMPVPGTDWSIDPIRRTVPGRILDGLINSGNVLNSSDLTEWKAMKLIELATGAFNPFAQAAAERAGIAAPAAQRGFGTIDDAMHAAAKALGSDSAPSDIIGYALGNDPAESRQEFADRRAQLYFGAAKNAGAPITPQAAAAQADDANWKARLFALTGQGFVHTPPGMAQALSDALDYRAQIRAAAPEDRPTIYLNATTPDPQKPGKTTPNIAAALPKDPQARFSGYNWIINNEESKVRAALADPNLQGDKQIRVNDIKRAAEESPLIQGAIKLFDLLTPDASGAERREEMQSDPAPAGYNGRWIKASNGTWIPAETTPQALAANREFTMAQTMVPRTSVEDVGRYIEQGKQADGSNPTLVLWKSMADSGNGAAKSVMAAHEYFITKGATPINGDLPAGTYANIASVKDSFAKYMTQGPKAWALVNGPPEAVVEAYRNGTIRGEGLGDNPDIGLYAARLAQQSIKPGLIGALHSDWQREQLKSFPGDADAKARLSSMVDVQARNPGGNPHRVSDVASEITQAVQDGTFNGKPISPTFWKDLASSPNVADRKLFNTAAVLYHAPEMDAQLSNLFTTDKRTGRVNGLYLDQMMQVMGLPGGKLSLAFARDHGTPDQVRALDAFANGWDRLVDSGRFPGAHHYDDIVPSGDDAIHDMTAPSFEFATGVRDHWSAKLGDGELNNQSHADPAKDVVKMEDTSLHGRLGRAPMSTEDSGDHTGHGPALSSGTVDPIALATSGTPAGAPAGPVSPDAPVAPTSEPAPRSEPVTKANALPELVGEAGLAFPLTAASAAVHAAPDRPFQNVMGFLRSSLEKKDAADQIWKAGGQQGAKPSFTGIALNDMFYQAPHLDDRGEQIYTPSGQPETVTSLAIPVEATVSALDAIGGVAEKLDAFGQPGSKGFAAGQNILQGVGIGMTTYSALTRLGLSATIPGLTFGAPAAAAATLPVFATSGAIAAAAPTAVSLGAAGATSLGASAVGAGAEGAVGAAAVSTEATADGAVLSSMGTAATTSASTGWGIPVAAAIAVAAAAYSIAGNFFGKRDTSAQERADMAAARLRQQQAIYAENLRKTSIQELDQREAALSKGVAGGGMTYQQRAQVQPQLAAFQRRPTYQSRIGLADSAERAIGSAIHPRW